MRLLNNRQLLGLAMVTAPMLFGCIPPPYDVPETEAEGDDDDNGDDDDDNDATGEPSEFPDPKYLNRDNDGYPEADDDEYGYLQGDVLKNAPRLVDKNGDEVSFKDLLAENDDAPDGYWRGMLIAFGAEWCGSCIEESRETLGPLAEEYAEKGIRFVHIILQNMAGGPASAKVCEKWDESNSKGAYPIWCDTSDGLKGRTPIINDGLYDVSKNETDIPIVLLVDANGNVRFHTTGNFSEKMIKIETDRLIKDPYGP